MDGPLRALLERTGVTRAEVPGLLVAAVGTVVALLVAVRVPLLAGPVPSGAGDASAVLAPSGGAPAGTTAGPVVAPSPSPSASAAVVLVHVAGAVASPGLVRLPAGARVADGIEAAGGPTDEAALVAVNLARPLVDGEQVHVPTVADVAAGTAAPAAGAGPGRDPGRLPDGRLDLNLADAAQLEELPGVGPVLAGRIVAHRDEVGGFDEATALREVPGIGEATWAGLRELVGVRDGAPP